MDEMLQKIILRNKNKIKCIKYNNKWGEVNMESDVSLYKK